MSYFREGNTTEKRRLELKILAKQADLAERLVEAKRQSLVQHNLSLFEESAKDKKLREAREVQERPLEDLKNRIHAAKVALERLASEKRPIVRGDLDTLRRQYFHTGDASTFMWRVDFAEVFEERGGFDVMIANPPYVRADKGKEHLAMRSDILQSGFYETLWEKWDLYVPFIERAYKMLRPNGVLEFITSDAYCHAKYAQRSQEWFLRNALVRRLDFVSDLQIFEAGVRNVLVCYQRTDGRNNIPLRIRHEGEFGSSTSLPSLLQNEATHRLFQPDSHKLSVATTIETVPLAHICYIAKGVVANADEKEHAREFVVDDLLTSQQDGKHPKRFVLGKDLSRWRAHQIRFIEWGTRRSPDHWSRPTFPELHDCPEKLITMRSPGQNPRTILDNDHIIFDASSVGFIPWCLLQGVRNRSIAKSAKYHDEAEAKLAKYREDLEDLSRSFSLKYILAVMNSSWVRDYLRSRRRSNIHLYPDDWKPLPIPVVSQNVQEVIANKVDEILKSLKKGQDVSELENEMDTMIFALYNTEKEESRASLIAL